MDPYGRSTRSGVLLGLILTVGGLAIGAWGWTSGMWLGSPAPTAAEAHPVVETAGAMATVPPATPEATAQPAASTFCQPGQSPSFVLGFATLKAELGDVMGAPLECEHVSSNGDTVQRTTTGLAYYRASTNAPTSTDGWHHWALTDRGLVTWVGKAVDPPPDAQAVPAG